MAELILTVYQGDDATVLFEVGTSKAHANPYLAWPDSFSASEVDLKNGGGVIGEVNLRVIDPQTGATQSIRWLTEKLGIPVGQTGEGHSAILGHRALLAWDDGRVVRDGTIKRASLNDSYAGFTLQLRDIRERGRKVDLFHSAARRDASGDLVNAPSVYPRGRFGGYGKLPQYEGLPAGLRRYYGWMQRPVAPLTGWVDSFEGSYFIDIWNTSGQSEGDGADIDPRWVLTDQAWEVMGRREQVEHNGDQAKNLLTDVRVLWRDPDSVDQTWKEIEVAGWGVNNIFEASTQRWVSYNNGGETVREKMRVPSQVNLGDGSTGSTMPPADTTIEFLIVYVGEPTDHYPFVYEGDLADFMQQMYDGDFSSHQPRLRYDASAVASLPYKVRIREYKKRDSLRNAEEEIYQAIGYAPSIVDGLIVPVSSRLQSGLGSLAEITDQNAEAIPGWEHDTSGSITDVLYTYSRDRRVPISTDPRADRSDGDGIASEEVKHKTPGPEWAKELIGDQEHEVNGWMFRALGTETGEPTSRVMDETGAQIAKEMGFGMIDRWLFGGQISACRVRAEDFPGLKPGTWVIDSRSWRPNYHTLQRGGPVVAQVMSLENLQDAWLGLVLVDAGPSLQPLATPTLGVLSVGAFSIITAPFTNVAGGAEAQYAVSDVEPPEDSSLWIFGGRREGDGSIQLPPAPEGSTVWVRGRSVKSGRFPSPWTTAKSIAVPVIPRASIRQLIAHSDGSVTIEWETNEHVGGIRLHWKLVDEGDEIPDPSDGGFTLDLQDVDEEVSDHVLPSATVGHGQRIVVGVEPWTGWSGSSVSGSAGDVSVAHTTRGDVPLGLAEGTVWTSVEGGLLDIYGMMEGLTSLFPIEASFFRDNPHGDPIDLDGAGQLEHTFAAPEETVGPVGGTVDGTPVDTEYSGLTDLSTPAEGSVPVWMRYVDADGVVRYATSSGDRDSLPSGRVTPISFRPDGMIRIRYDDDVDEQVRITTPSGKTKTWAAGDLTPGGGVLTYTVGTTQLDDLSFENLLDPNETRESYVVEVTGAGVTTEIGAVALHGSLPSLIAGYLRADVQDDGTVDIYGLVEGELGGFPATFDLYQEEVSVASHIGVEVWDAVDEGTEKLLASGVVLPLVGSLEFHGRLEDAQGVATWAYTRADRNTHPGGRARKDDLKTAPQIYSYYDDDTEQVRITLPDGRTKTFSGLVGGGDNVYEVGDALDDATTEDPFAEDESRGPYQVDFIGGGMTVPIASFTLDGPVGGTSGGGNQIIVGELAWRMGLETAVLNAEFDYGSLTRSIRVQYQYQIPPTGVPTSEPAPDYTFDVAAGGGHTSHAIRDVNGVDPKTWVPEESPPTITFTPYDDVGGAGTAGTPKVVTAEALATTGRVGFRGGNKNGTTEQSEFVQFDDDSGLALVMVGGQPQVGITEIPASRGGTGISNIVAGQYMRGNAAGDGWTQVDTIPWADVDLTGASAFVTRWPDWDEVTDKPSNFPPAPHDIGGALHTGVLGPDLGGLGASYDVLLPDYAVLYWLDSLNGGSGGFQALTSAPSNSQFLGKNAAGTFGWHAIPGTLPSSGAAGTFIRRNAAGTAWEVSAYTLPDAIIPTGEFLYGDGAGNVTHKTLAVADVGGLQTALDGKLGDAETAADSALLNGQVPSYYTDMGNATGTLAVNRGGTGAGTAPARAVMVGDGSAWQRAAAPATGDYYITSLGGLVAWRALPGTIGITDDSPPAIGRFYVGTGTGNGDHAWSQWALPTNTLAEGFLYRAAGGSADFRAITSSDIDLSGYAQLSGATFTGSVTVDSHLFVDGQIIHRDYNGATNNQGAWAYSADGNILYWFPSPGGAGNFNKESRFDFTTLTWTHEADTIFSGTVSVGNTFTATVGTSALRFTDASGTARLLIDGANGDFSGADYWWIEQAGSTAALSVRSAAGPTYSFGWTGTFTTPDLSVSGTMTVSGLSTFNWPTRMNHRTDWFDYRAGTNNAMKTDWGGAGDVFFFRPYPNNSPDFGNEFHYNFTSNTWNFDSGVTVGGNLTVSGSISFAGTLAVADGGTGDSTAPVNAIMVGDGGAWNRLAPTTSGQVLTYSGGLLKWLVPSASGGLTDDDPPAANRWYRATGTAAGAHAWSAWGLPAAAGAAGTFLEAGGVGWNFIHIADVSGLQTELDGKANTSALSSYMPKSGGTFTGAVGFGGQSPSWEAHVNGTLAATNIRKTSDRRFKRDIHDLPYERAVLMGLRPRGWRWDEAHGGLEDVGFVAQEVEAIWPGPIVARDADGVLTLSYDHLTPLLVGAAQDHETRIQRLERENTELRHRVAELEAA